MWFCYYFLYCSSIYFEWKIKLIYNTRKHRWIKSYPGQSGMAQSGKAQSGKARGQAKPRVRQSPRSVKAPGQSKPSQAKPTVRQSPGSGKARGQAKPGVRQRSGSGKDWGQAKPRVKQRLKVFSVFFLSLPFFHCWKLKNIPTYFSCFGVRFQLSHAIWQDKWF